MKELKLKLKTEGVCKLNYKLFKTFNMVTAKVFVTFRNERLIIVKSASNLHFLARKINFAISDITKDKEEAELCLVS